MFLDPENRPSGEEPRRKKPILPRDVQLRISGAEQRLEELAVAFELRREDTSMIGKRECMDIDAYFKQTTANMLAVMTDARFYAGCHDPAPHVSEELARDYIHWAIEQAKTAAANITSLPTENKKLLRGEIPDPWTEEDGLNAQMRATGFISR